MIIDRQLYNEGLKISCQLITQFDKERIRQKLINIYTSLLNDSAPTIAFPGNWTEMPFELS